MALKKFSRTLTTDILEIQTRDFVNLVLYVHNVLEQEQVDVVMKQKMPSFPGSSREASLQSA